MSAAHENVGQQTVDELRPRWEAGQHRAVLRAILERWDEALAYDGDVAWIERALRDAGLSAQAFALQAKLVRRRARVGEWQLFIGSVLRSGDPWWARELLRESGTPTRGLQALHIETELALAGDDAPALISAWTWAHGDPEAREQAVGWWVEAGRVGDAERIVEETGDLPVWQARFALWRGQPEMARRHLHGLTSPRARCLTAIATVLEGALDDAEARLRPLLDSDARGEAAVWLCSVLRRRGRFREAQAVADIAFLSSPGFPLVARLERELAAVCERAGGDNPSGSTLRAWRQRLALWLHPVSKLENATALYALGLRPRDSLRALERLLERFAGNHSAHLTTVDGGKLTACKLPQDPRQLGALVQRVLWTRGPDVARALYRELASSVDGHPLYRIYQGELELWMGEYDVAAGIFDQALRAERRTRWAWIGLGACHMLQGELSRAQKVWAQGEALTGTPGPTLYVYRGECYRRQGDRRRARAELETALRQKPQRLSAQINLALLDSEAEALTRVERACIEHAPVLMEHLHGTTAERLEQVLESMRGNRSSSPWHMSYHLWGHLWRRAS